MPKKKMNPQPGPVSTTWLPVVRCEVCRQTMAYQPGKAAAVLTEHYRRKHLALAVLSTR
jgi:hypothetical protein